MPKFYVSDGAESTIINADSPLQACFRSIQYRFQGIPVGGFYKVSEQGFENHDEDVIFSSDEVITAFIDMMNKTKSKKNHKEQKNDQEGD
tara:strand:+ start:381 stop:650 length:270 start_codon:yes stop_codon:yes gene_type:complete